MLIGVPKEIKVREYRVGLTPANARELPSAATRSSWRPGPGRAWA